MRRIVWTEPAQADVTRIRRYIARFRPKAAQRMAEDLYSAAETLGEYPERGKPLTKGRRELLVILPYRVIYRVTDDTVLILRVRIQPGSQASGNPICLTSSTTRITTRS